MSRSVPDSPAVEWNPAYNFRDLGGLPTEDGRQTLPGRLYRSATLHDLGDDGAAELRRRFGNFCVVDLRTPDEVEAQGAGSAAAWFRCMSLPVVPPPLPPDGPADLLSRYFAYLDNSTFNIIATLRLMSSDAGPVAVHCTSGKDRTGVVTALLLRLAGVTPAAVVADYAATAANVPHVMERLGRKGPQPLRAADIPPEILEAEGETIRAFLERLEERFGGVDAWAFEHGLDRSDVDTLQATFIRPIH